MKLLYAPKFKDSFCQFPENIKRKFYQKAGYLLKNIRHPSLHAKKYDEARGIWQARVNRDIRFYFQASERKTKSKVFVFPSERRKHTPLGFIF